MVYVTLYKQTKDKNLFYIEKIIINKILFKQKNKAILIKNDIVILASNVFIKLHLK